MLGRGPARILILLLILFIFTCTLFLYSPPYIPDWRSVMPDAVPYISKDPSDPEGSLKAPEIHSSLPAHYIYNNVDDIHREVFSTSTPDGKYFLVDFKSEIGYNPNILPHETRNDSYYIVAQKLDYDTQELFSFTEMICIAQFVGHNLQCIEEPWTLPIAATTGDKCHGDLVMLGQNIGPHDARVLYGPEIPFVVYGSNSEYTCFGQFVQDFRELVVWTGGKETDNDTHTFSVGTELQRPAPFGKVEKNFFLFWDTAGTMYNHVDVSPRRVFAQVHSDGSSGEDLAPQAVGDAQCMAKYMPAVAEELESIHQATNSLSITLCNRSDTSCIENDPQTYIITIFHHKSYYAFHSNYEQYVMIFNQNPPFEIYGISKKPIWFHGRGRPGEGARPKWFSETEPWDHTEMVYATSMAWKEHGQKYHGHLDDILFIGFGVEDLKTAAIDIKAGDLLLDLGLC